MQIDKKNKGAPDEYELHVAENSGNYQVKAHKYENAIAKVLCVLAAVVLWFYVVGTNTTVDETTFTGIAVQMNGLDKLESDYGLSVLSGYDYTVDLTVRGARSTLGNISADDLSAYVDLGSITEAGEYTLEIGTALPNGITIGSQSSNYVKLYIDRRTTINVPVEAEIVTFTMDAIYSLGTPVTGIETVLVTGPAEVLEQISRAVVKLELGTVTGTMNSTGKLQLVDDAGNPVSNPYVKLHTTETSVHIPVYMEKEIPLTVSYKYNYYNDSNVTVSINPKTIRIKGDSELLRDIDSVTLQQLDEKKIIEDTSMSTAIMLPEGVENLSGVRTADIQITHRNTEVRTLDIMIASVNNPNNLKYTLESDSIQVSVRGIRSLISMINRNNTSATIDLGYLNKASGTVSVSVSINIAPTLQGSVYEIGEYKMNVTID